MTEQLTGDNLSAAYEAPSFALSFLLGLHPIENTREGMPGFKDSAIFYRTWDLTNTFCEPAFLELFDETEKGVINDFLEEFNKLPWVVIPEHNHIKELEDDDMTSLYEPARKLYELLQQNKPLTRRRWQARVKSWLLPNR